MKIGGEWCDNPETILNRINSYYNNLFACTNSYDELDFDFPMGPKLTDRDNNILTLPHFMV